MCIIQLILNEENRIFAVKTMGNIDIVNEQRPLFSRIM